MPRLKPFTFFIQMNTIKHFDCNSFDFNPFSCLSIYLSIYLYSLWSSPHIPSSCSNYLILFLSPLSTFFYFSCFIIGTTILRQFFMLPFAPTSIPMHALSLDCEPTTILLLIPIVVLVLILTHVSYHVLATIHALVSISISFFNYFMPFSYPFSSSRSSSHLIWPFCVRFFQATCFICILNISTFLVDRFQTRIILP